MFLSKRLLAITTFITLSACGSGGSDTEPTTNSDEISKCVPAADLRDPTSKAAGFYTGTFNNDLGAIAQDAFALVAPNGKIAIASENELATGVIDIFPGAVSNSTIDLWSSPTTYKRYTLASTSVDYRVGMTIDSGYSLMGDGWDGDFRYAIPKLPTCLENSTISDTWSAAANGSAISITFEQNNSIASLTGATSSGCIISGRIESFGIEGGIFSIRARYENCPDMSNNGNFSGLGALISSGSERADTMLLVLSNLDSSKRFSLKR